MTLQEQQEFEGDNIATIAAQQIRIDELTEALKESTELIMDNATLRDDLVAGLQSQHAFIAAFEKWLEDRQTDTGFSRSKYGTSAGLNRRVASKEARQEWYELKAEHGLSQNKSTAK